MQSRLQSRSSRLRLVLRPPMQSRQPGLSSRVRLVLRPPMQSRLQSRSSRVRLVLRPPMQSRRESVFKSAFGAPASDAKPPAESVLKSLHNSYGGDSGLWKCIVCGKAKELGGKHLIGKTKVRSDCWPCGKKTTFNFEEQTTVAPEQLRPNAKGRELESSTIGVSGTARTAEGFQAPRVPMESDEDMCLVPTLGRKAEERTASDNCFQEWKCRVCGKAKPLAGKHLEGKREVRSDCWPCAAKRTFYLTTNQSTADAKPPAESVFKTPFGAPASDAKPPAELVFKSAFGAPASDAKPPAESVFKSAFGAPASDAKPPAESVFKSAFGAPASDAKP
ncbi:hypothetical protein TraAM80_09118, partial [Trypanosoma rangeli]